MGLTALFGMGRGEPHRQRHQQFLHPDLFGTISLTKTGKEQRILGKSSLFEQSKPQAVMSRIPLTGIRFNTDGCLKKKGS